MLTTITIHKRSPFLGEECALCKDPFAPGDSVVICPEDGSRHHARCWLANDSRCAAFGCDGRGNLTAEESPQATTSEAPSHTAGPGRVQRRIITRPSSSFGCGQTCLLIGIAVAIIFFSIGCFGIWAIADYLMLNVWDLPYRQPLTGSLLLPGFFVSG